MVTSPTAAGGPPLKATSTSPPSTRPVTMATGTLRRLAPSPPKSASRGAVPQRAAGGVAGIGREGVIWGGAGGGAAGGRGCGGRGRCGGPPPEPSSLARWPAGRRPAWLGHQIGLVDVGHAQSRRPLDLAGRVELHLAERTPMGRSDRRNDLGQRIVRMVDRR